MIEFTTTITVVLRNNRTVESIKININLKTLKMIRMVYQVRNQEGKHFLWTILIRTAIL